MRWTTAALQLFVMGALTAFLVASISPGAAVKGDLQLKLLYLARMAALVAAASVLLRLSGRRWSDVGLRGASAVRFFLSIPLGFVAAFLLAGAANLTLTRLGVPGHADYSMFAPIRGDSQLFLFFAVPVSWGAAAFGEEMLFRGFFLDTLQRLFGSSGPVGVTVAIGLQAFMFGLLHLYQGWAGVATAGAIGLAFGFTWWFAGRNLWPGIVLHGIFDSMSMTAIYLGLMQTG
jgi:membrane protease YdiL (CAAX protease family)